jgi:hypothetical protein
MAKQATLTTLSAGHFDTAKLNTNFTNINTALNNTLSLDGSTPNSMSGDIDLNSNVLLNGLIDLDEYTVATLPAASGRTSYMAYVSDGDGGSPCVAVSNGTNWLRIALGATVSAS